MDSHYASKVFHVKKKLFLHRINDGAFRSDTAELYECRKLFPEIVYLNLGLYSVGTT